MDWHVFSCIDRAALINGLADNVDDSSEGFGTNGHHNGTSSVLDTLPPDKSLSGIQGNCAHVVSSQMLRDLKHEAVVSPLNLKRVENGWKLSFELHIDDGTNNL